MEVRAERRFTLADIYDAPEDLARREIIDGVLYVSPSPRVGHQRAIRHLVLILDAWCRQHGGEVLPGGVNLDLGEDTHLEPDVAVLAPGRPVPDGSTRALTTPPDIVVEVSSRSTRSYDAGPKRARYARAGTPELWLVDLEEQTVEISRLAGDRWYGDPVALRAGDTLTSPLLPGFTADVSEILAAAS